MKKPNLLFYLGLILFFLVLYHTGTRKAGIDSPLIYPTYTTQSLNGLNIVPKCQDGDIVSTTTEVNFRKLSNDPYKSSTQYIAFDSDKTDLNLECFQYYSFNAGLVIQFPNVVVKTTEGYDVIFYQNNYVIKTKDNPIYSLVQDSSCPIPLDKNSILEYSADGREAFKYSIYTGVDSYTYDCGTVSCVETSNTAKCQPYCKQGEVCYLGDIHQCLDGTQLSFAIKDCQVGCVEESGDLYCQEDRCSGTATECRGSDLWQCKANRLEKIQICPLGCLNGECLQKCDPNKPYCDANDLYQCGPSGFEATLVKTCIECKNGACIQQCSPGNTRCNGQNVEVCNAEGSAYVLSKACPYICSEGVCENQCVPNTDKSCDETKVTVCNAQGSGYVPTGQTCAYQCIDGECVDACTASTKVCIGDRSYTCNTQGSGYDSSKTKDCALGCDVATGTCKTCTTGQTKCENGIKYSCNLDKLSYTQIETCDSGCANAYTCKGCTPGVEMQCNGNNLEACTSDGLSFSPKQTCTLGCQNNQCNICVPGAISCTNNVKQVCSTTGQTVSTLQACTQGCYQEECDKVTLSLQSSNFIYGTKLIIPVQLQHTIDGKPIGSVTVTGKIEDINKQILEEYSGITNSQGVANLVYTKTYQSGQYNLLLSGPYQSTNLASTKEFSVVSDIKVTTPESPILFLDAIDTITLQTKDVSNQLVTVDGLEVIAKIDNATVQTSISQSGLGTYEVTLLSPASGQLVMEITPTQEGSKTTTNTLSFLLKKPYLRATVTYPLQTSIGKTHDIVVDIFNTNNVREEATSVVIKSTDPSGSVETIPMQRVAKGLFTYKMTFEKAGTYSMVITPERQDYDVKTETITITVSEGVVLPSPKSPTMIFVYIGIAGVIGYILYKYVLKGRRRK